MNLLASQIWKWALCPFWPYVFLSAGKYVWRGMEKETSWIHDESNSKYNFIMIFLQIHHGKIIFLLGWKLVKPFKRNCVRNSSARNHGSCCSIWEQTMRPVVIWLSCQVASMSSQIWCAADAEIVFERLEEGFESALKDYLRKQVCEINMQK